MTTLSTAGMKVALPNPNSPRMRLDYDWSDATVTDCNALLKWSEGSHIAGDLLRTMSSTAHVARLNLGDLRDLVVEEKPNGLSKYVTIVVEVSEGKPPFQIERGAEKTLTRESVQRYVFHADAEPGRSFAEQMQAEINRCRSR